jgi:WD40 repeat protein/DNA-binding SARP family transcriptional activator/energy-coupling factor transporter ATP-binding protein EcfA2
VIDSRLEFLVLGPLDVRVGGVSVRIGGAKQRALLAMLLLSANRPVSRDRLIGELRDEQIPEGADHALRVQVWRLRRTLAPDGSGEPRLLSRAPGYLLRVEPGELDLDLFERQVAAGRTALEQGDPARAAQLLRSAEALWRGRPLADLEFEPFVRIEVERLEELRIAAVEQRVDAELALGRHAALVPELESAIAEQPLRERLRAQLMLALYRSGRQAESLAVYRRTREHLNDELGLEPGVALQQLERAILIQDPSLDAHPRSATAAQAPALDDEYPVCPFKGLAAFEAADAEYFFGRVRLVGELTARIADSALLAIVGPSGSGKSSLLRAGLLPALAAVALPESELWRQVLLRPGRRPATELARLLGGSLGQAIARLRPGGRIVIAIDQFEEVFTLCEDERERRAFIDALVEAAWDPERRCALLLVLRADFFGRLGEFPDLAELVGAGHVLLGPMNGRELRSAIEGPAERAGLLVEPGLVEALVGDVAGEPGGLPLLSTALVDLWEQRQGRSLQLEAYERMGRVQGSVANHAERAYGSLSADQQQIARRLLLRLAAGGDDRPVTRRRVALTELDLGRDGSAARVLAALTDSRLLTAGDGAIEVAHEALLEHWPRFREWLAEDAEGRRLHRHLTEAAVHWAAAGDAGELYRGARLSAALDWAEGTDHDLALNDLEREFLGQSRAASLRESEHQRRTHRRLRLLLCCALALLLAALGAGTVAWQQGRQADRQATAAVAGRLGAQALIEPRLDRSLLLARAGVSLDDSPASRGNLLAALVRNPAALAVISGGGDRVLDDAVSRDGRMLAVGGDDGNVTLYDSRTLRQLGRAISGDSQIGKFGNVLKPIHALAFSPDGRTLAIGSTTGTYPITSLVDTGTRAQRWIRTSTSNATTTDVAFAPDGRRLVTGELTTGEGSAPGEVIIVRDATSGSELARSRAFSRGRLAGITMDGRSVLVSGGARRSYLLDARTLKPLWSFDTGGIGAVSPAAPVAALGHDDGTVTVIDLATRRLRTLSGRAGASIQALIFSADGKVLASADANGSLAVWDIASASLAEILPGHAGAASGVALSPDGATLYSVGIDGSAIAWDVTGRRRLGQRFGFDPVGPPARATATEHRSPVAMAVAVTPDGSLFATAPGRGRVTLWHARTLTPEAHELHGPVGDVISLAFSGDGRLLAATGSTRQTAVWEVRTGRLVRTLTGGGPHGSGAVAFSRDDLTLAVTGLDGDVVLHDLRNGAADVLAAGHSIADVDFSLDGRFVAAAGLAGQVSVWDLARRKLVMTMEDPGRLIFTLRYSPDGKMLAAGDDSGNVVFWDARTGRLHGPSLNGHGGAVISVSFRPDGQTLATVSQDGNFRLWDVATRRLIGAPLPAADTGGWGTFFPDGRRVIAAFSSGVAAIWNVDPAAWETRACAVAHRNLRRAEWSNYLPGQSFRNVCA